VSRRRGTIGLGVVAIALIATLAALAPAANAESCDAVARSCEQESQGDRDPGAIDAPDRVPLVDSSVSSGPDSVGPATADPAPATLAASAVPVTGSGTLPFTGSRAVMRLLCVGLALVLVGLLLYVAPRREDASDVDAF
jgi:hypothetical protein